MLKQGMKSSSHACKTGWAAAENIWYLQDMNNVLAGELFPQLTERFDDWLAHPGPGRVADEVAEFYFLHRSALLNSSPLKPRKSYFVGVIMSHWCLHAVQGRCGAGGKALLGVYAAHQEVHD